MRPETHSFPRFAEWALFGVCLLGSWWVTGYQAYGSNHALQLPLVHWLNDSQLYPGDPFAASLPKFASLFWRLVATLSRAIPLQVVLFLLFVVERVALLASVRWLARSFVPDAPRAAILPLLWIALLPRPAIGDGQLVATYAEQTGFAIPLYLFSIAAVYRGRLWLAALCFAAGFSANSLYGVYAAAYCVSAFLARPPHGVRARSLAGPILLGIAACLPALWPSLQAYAGDAGTDSPWTELALLRFPHHLRPTTWGDDAWIRASLVLLVVVASVLLRREHRSASGRFALASVGWMCAWIALAFVGEFWIQAPQLLMLQPARGTDLGYLLVCVYLLAYVSTARAPSTALCVSALVPGALLGEATRWLCLAAFALVMLARRYRPPGLARPRLVVAGALVILAIAGLPASQFEQKWSPGVSGDADQLAVAEWARQHSDVGARFIVPFRWDMFRALSQRSVFFGWKEGSALLWDRGFADAWAERLQLLGHPVAVLVAEPQRFRTLIENPDPGQLATLAVSGHADYLVTRAVLPHTRRLEAVAQFGGFRIYAVRP